MNTVQKAVEFFAEVNKTHSVELTKSELFDIQNALSNRMYEVISDQTIKFDERRAYYNQLSLIKAKLEAK